MSRPLLSVLALSVFMAGCATTMKLSPREEPLILLPQNSTASITSHFRQEERHTYWFHQAFSGNLPTPMDTLARAAGNQPVRNATISSSPDWLLFHLKFAAALGAWALVSVASPAAQPYGPWAYLAVFFALPDAIHIQVEGDRAGESPAQVQER